MDISLVIAIANLLCVKWFLQQQSVYWAQMAEAPSSPSSFSNQESERAFQ